MGSGGASGTGGISGAGGAAVACTVTLAAVSPPSFSDLESGPNARLRIKATVSNGRPATWTWTVIFQNTAVIPATPIDDPSVVEFPIGDAGQYDVTARAIAGTTCAYTVRLHVNPPCSTCFVFRVNPTANNPDIPTQEQRIDLARGSMGIPFNLAAGTKISVAPQAMTMGGGRSIVAYVRVSNLASGVALDGYTAHGPFDVSLLPPLVAYDVVIIPDEPLAPQRLSASAPQLSQATLLTLDAGTSVTGIALDGSGAPVVGVRVGLRDGSLPSTLGVSDGAGQFSLLARPGSLSAVIAPPDTAGLPEAHVSGIALDAVGGNAPGLDLSMTWAAVPRGALSMVVRTTDGSGPAVGARVRVESDAEIANVGTLVARAPNPAAVPVTLPASGSVRIDLDVDANGVARFPSLPTGTYKVTVVPPATMAGAALTITRVTLPATGFTGTMPLARPIMLSGTLLRPPVAGSQLPAAGVKGVQVIARDQSTGIVAPVVSAITGDGGAYALSVAPDRRYQLVADPPTGLGLARTVLGVLQVGATDAGTLMVAPGTLVKGTVKSNLRLLGGAVIQVFCAGSSATCLDPTTPVAEAVTQPDGTFTVSVPASTFGP